MLHAFATDDFLNAIDDFDRHARGGLTCVSGNFCRHASVMAPTESAQSVFQGLWASAIQGEGPFESVWWGRAWPVKVPDVK